MQLDEIYRLFSDCPIPNSLTSVCGGILVGLGRLERVYALALDLV
jgi:hypothetical protein